MKPLKYLLPIFILGVFSRSCNIGDDRDGIVYGYIKAKGSHVVGETKPTGEETKISVSYTITNSCQEFVQFQTLKNEDSIIEIAILGQMRQSNDCVSISAEQSKEFTFTPSHSGDYTFKFWEKESSYKNLVITINDPKKI